MVPTPSIPKAASSAARRAPILALPNTWIPRLIAHKISLWRTVGTDWKYPSIIPIAWGRFKPTLNTSPSAAGGKYTASSSRLASDAEIVGPVNTQTFTRFLELRLEHVGLERTLAQGLARGRAQSLEQPAGRIL